MNILVIGNGFDLAHNLPTKYGDFLNYTKACEYCMNVNNLHANKKGKKKKVHGVSNDMIKHAALLQAARKELFDELSRLIENNVWLRYFYNVQIKGGWIDFESEISRVIQAFEDGRRTVLEDIASGKMKGNMTQGQLNVLNPFVEDSLLAPNFRAFGNALYKRAGIMFELKGPSFDSSLLQSYKSILLYDLKRLIRCLEIYLETFVVGAEMGKILPDIEGLPIIDKVLSFNYTNTYKRLYDIDSLVEIDYIHGKADITNTIDSNNMVLGIDEYLRGDERNENIEFIEFKKYYQRIHKETGSLYRSWLENMEEDSKRGDIKEIKSIIKDEDGKSISYTREHVAFHRVYFFGHSLDITDKEVLQSFILADKVQTTIFYRNKEDYGKKIANLVRVIGQDELIERTGGKNKTITFTPITELVKKDE